MKSTIYSNRRQVMARRRMALRRSLTLLVLFSILTGLLFLLNPAPAVRAQTDQNLWDVPVNVSSSGSASLPSMATEANGRVHVMWWDKFDGAKYSYRDEEGVWSAPALVPGIYGQRTRGQNGKIETIPPSDLTLVTDNQDHLYTLWRLSTGDLMFSQSDLPTTKLSGGTRLASSPLLWKLFVAPDDSLHFVYIRYLSTGNVEPGVYYRQSKNGRVWTDPILIAPSLYFRSLPGSSANVNVVSDGADKVLVGWDDPQTGQSNIALSKDGGETFGDPEPVKSGGIAEVAFPTRVRFTNVKDQGFLRFWEAGDSCVLYQQSLKDDDSWTVPLRAIEQVNGCLRTATAYPAKDGRVFLTVGASTGQQATLTAWDGKKWAEPLSPQATFINPATNSLVALNCATLGLTQKSVVLLGCDAQSDIWVLTSKLAPEEFLPMAQSSWGPAVILSRGFGDAGFPTITVDSQGRFHVMWPQLPAPGNPGEVISYIRGTGAQWTDPASILQVPLGTIRSASLLNDPNDMLHVVWSGGTTGQIFYNQTFERDALLPDYWGEPKLLPATQPVGDSPNIVIGASGKLYAVYAVPYNEGRGLYFTASSDLGQSWSNPTEIFDAAAAGWGVIHEASLVLDQQEHLHVAWSRAASANQVSPLGVYYAQSTDGGATWSQPLTVSEAADSNPKLIVASDNALHLVWVRAALNGHAVFHQWSADGGQSWSRPAPVPGVGIVAPELGLTADAGGSVYLAGIELTKEGSAGLFYVRWNGETWTDRDSLRLGYDFNEGSGARLAMLPSGLLGVFYRVWSPNTSASASFALGYVGRQIGRGADFTPGPTFTPRPTATVVPAATNAPTLTPISIGTTGAGTESSGGGGVLGKIGLVVLAMVVISGFAIIRLWGRIGR